ncbi:MAG: glycosyltransferase family 4 protein [Saprospiraceae bacterium]|nr:glycosyltransferase family 4 protein [Candidatus Defluviibacterium haderslevense]
MRIAVNARFLLSGKLEGIGWYSFEVLRRMTKEHPEHEFIFIFDRTYSEEFIFGSNVIPVVLQPPARHPILWYIWFEWRLPALLKKLDVDMFLSLDGYCSLRSTTPQYLVMHDLAYLHYPKQIKFAARHFYKYFVPKYLNKASHVFAVSNATKQDIIRHITLNSAHVSVAYNGCRDSFVPIDEDQKQKIRDDYTGGRDYFLFVGAMHPRKNVDQLIRAFDHFKQKDKTSHKLVLVGRMAWYSEKISEAYESSRYKSDIIFCDYMATETLVKITGAATAAICPSFLEGFGVPIAEALFCDVPVIVSDRFSLPEVGGPGAYLINPDEYISISEAMSQVIHDPLLEKRIEQGRIHRKQFSWDQTAELIFYRMMQDFSCSRSIF